jgi:hypothetical protein
MSKSADINWSLTSTQCRGLEWANLFPTRPYAVTLLERASVTRWSATLSGSFTAREKAASQQVPEPIWIWVAERRSPPCRNSNPCLLFLSTVMKKSSSATAVRYTRASPLTWIPTSNENKWEMRYSSVKQTAVKTAGGWSKRVRQNLDCYDSTDHKGRVAEKIVTEIWGK